MLSQFFSHISLQPSITYHGQYSQVTLFIALQANIYFVSHFSLKTQIRQVSCYLSTY